MPNQQKNDPRSYNRLREYLVAATNGEAIDRTVHEAEVLKTAEDLPPMARMRIEMLAEAANQIGNAENSLHQLAYGGQAAITEDEFVLKIPDEYMAQINIEKLISDYYTGRDYKQSGQTLIFKIEGRERICVTYTPRASLTTPFYIILMTEHIERFPVSNGETK